MNASIIGQTPLAPESAPTAPAPAGAPSPDPNAPPARTEIGGRDGPDPTRYGDWEKNGRCIDF
ncbi:MAG TPA: DUF1674 domain-containing protein [Thermomonas sp.]